MLQIDDAWETMNDLGKIDCIQIIDLNKDKLPHELKYAKMIRNIDDLERRIKLVEEECQRHNIEMREPESSDQLYIQIEKLCQGKNELTLIDNIDNELKDREQFIVNQIKQIKQLHKNYNQQIGYKNVLEQATIMLGHEEFDLGVDEEKEEHEDTDSLIQRHHSSSFQPIVGTVSKKDHLRMKKLIFRASRGKAYTQFFDLKEKIFDYQGNQLDTTIFFVLFPSNFEFLKDRLIKICDSYLGQRFTIPKSLQEIKQQLRNIKNNLDNLYHTLNLSIDYLKKYLAEIHLSPLCEGYSLIKVYKQTLKKSKNIFMNLNKMKQKGSLLIGLFWVPKKLEHRAYEGLSIGKRSRVAQIQPIKEDKLDPPTHFDINEFVWPFHEIVVTYGIPTYKEINPTAFNIVTFPFLFGLMFGDIGHGLILFLFASYLCFKKDYILQHHKSLFLLLKIRYLLLFMGFFATYCGFIYNDMMAMPLNIFGSCYENVENNEVVLKDDCIYPFGIDPKWYVSKNELAFLNSLKMKMAVIYGVMQMSLGVFLKGLNCIQRRSALDFIFEYIPQQIFLFALFGFMDLLIVLKWLTNWEGKEHLAPSVISQMINNFLNKGEINGSPLIGDAEYQQQLAMTLLVICLICVPIMLYVKPIYLAIKYRKEDALAHKKPAVSKRLEQDQSERKEDESESKQLIKEKTEEEDWYKNISEGMPSAGKEEHSFGELFIHQMIETIEFVLGTVSNTASYLRLWALSLAHSQLAKVFFEKTIGMALEVDSIFLMIVSFFVFAGITFFVLLFMDVLECFLHDLRLHWVEFQNKFYKGLGYQFVPFSHERTLFPNKLNQ